MLIIFVIKKKSKKKHEPILLRLSGLDNSLKNIYRKIIMMILLNCLVYPKDGVQSLGRARKRREIKEREDEQEHQRQARMLTQDSHGQECWKRGVGENMDGGMGFYSTRRAEGLGVNPILLR